MDRVILHSDINSCYANIERLYHPELAEEAVAVGGDPEKRHGIILAKDDRCKKFGVKTGMAIWQAKQLCPQIVVLPPRMKIYKEFSKKVQNIYSDYTDVIEPFGIDESWLDLTGCTKDGAAVARELGSRIKKELGVTVSVGVSWNKVFAKLGSDYKKPDAVTIIDRARYKEIVWPLRTSELLYVGNSTAKRLEGMGINTIGKIANSSPELLHRSLGKMGPMLYAFANGNDRSPVRRAVEMPEIKSIGNGTTTPRDMCSEDDVWITLMTLCESVGMRLREKGFMAACLEISVRSLELEWQTHQMKLHQPTDITKELLDVAFTMFKQIGSPLPLRSISVRCSKLIYSDVPEQLDIFTDWRERDRLRRLDGAMDRIRRKYGYNIVKRGTLGVDIPLGSLNAKEEHTVHPLGFLNGYSMDEAMGAE